VLENKLRLSLGKIMLMARDELLESLASGGRLMHWDGKQSRRASSGADFHNAHAEEFLILGQAGDNEISQRIIVAALDYKITKPAFELVNELNLFFADRLKVTLREKGVRHDLIDAVFSLGGEDDLVRLMARVDALQSFIASDDGANLLTAYKRASNIVGIEEKKDKTTYDEAVDPALLTLPEESKLSQALTQAHAGTKMALDKEEFGAAMTVLALLRGPVDAFFDKVKVNADEPAVRQNRLCLLSQIRATLGEVADFSKIEG
jgi:glycyl-tRNA synthetase beta subunit